MFTVLFFKIKGWVFIVKISILDYAVIDENKKAVSAVNETIELAKHAEALNFNRFFVAEHHNVKAFASTSPELLMMKLLDETKSIKIGSAGVMIPHYAPLKVAENFRMLEAFHPGRVDLGFGSTIGTSIVQRAMHSSREGFDYKMHIEEIQNLLSEGSSEEFKNIIVNPVIEKAPNMWILSTSQRSAKIAANLGIGYIFGLFPYASNDKTLAGKRAIEIYREEFQPSKTNAEAHAIVAVFVVIANTKDEAKTLAKALDVWLLGKENFNEFNSFPSVETAENYNYSQADLRRMKSNRTRMIVGTKSTVKEKLSALQHELNADELLIIPLMPEFKNRKHALTLISETFEL